MQYEMSCSFQSQYEISYRFDQQFGKEQSNGGEISQLTGFNITVFSDDSFSIFNTGVLIAGQPIFVEISPSDTFDTSFFEYRVTSCTVSNTLTGMAYKFFNIIEGECTNSAIGFSLWMDAGRQRLSYDVFLFSEDPTSSYELNCDVLICVKNSGACQNIDDNC